MGSITNKPRTPAVLEPSHEGYQITSVPIESIRILNPRSRSRRLFADFTKNIATLGLKRPITVARRHAEDGTTKYDLVCGQGRLEAFQTLGEKHVPAVIIEADETECFLMSLVENLARRNHSNVDLLSAITRLQERGYSNAEIATKTNLEISYIQSIIQLLKAGEDRLIGAVEKGYMPIRLALGISHCDDSDLRKLLVDAYEEGTLKGKQLMMVKRLLSTRRAFGKAYQRAPRKREAIKSTQALVRAYEAEVRRQRVIVRKAEVAERRLLLLMSALRKLLSDDNFKTLLRAEGFTDVPRYVSDHLAGGSVR